MKNDPSEEKIDLASLNLGKVVHVAQPARQISTFKCAHYIRGAVTCQKHHGVASGNTYSLSN